MSLTEASKRAMRAEARRRRAAIPTPVREQAASAIAEAGVALLQPHAGAVVSGFSAIGDEIDPAPLLERLHALGWPLALPAVRDTEAALTFRSWAPGAPLAKGRWGIAEPLPDAPAVRPAVILMPLLAFDRRGGRIGYGGGFYDRTLHQLRASGAVLAIGLAFDEQMVDDVPCLDYDEKMDWVLTPAGALECIG